MFFIVYVSSAVTPFAVDELVLLLETSRRNNAPLSVTGMLLYKDGNFMQMLEGPETSVRALYAKISKDSRHRGAIILLQGHRPDREFEDWAMAFESLHDPRIRDLPGYSEFMNVPLTDAQFASNPSKCLKLFGSFKKSMR